MAALTAAYDAKRKDGQLIAYPMAAVKIYKGALVIVTSATGFVSTGSDAAGVGFVGVAYETVDNTAGAAGGANIRLQKTGEYIYTAVGAAQTDVGKTAYLVSDGTVQTAATTNSIAVGKVVGYISATQLVVRIDGSVN